MLNDAWVSHVGGNGFGTLNQWSHGLKQKKIFSCNCSSELEKKFALTNRLTSDIKDVGAKKKIIWLRNHRMYTLLKSYKSPWYIIKIADEKPHIYLISGEKDQRKLQRRNSYLHATVVKPCSVDR